jgi:hypothetical protein
VTEDEACGTPQLSHRLWEAWPEAEPPDESPAGKNRRGTPAGERAHKRGAAQAALLRGASRTPLACGHRDNASAGVPPPYFLPEARHLDWASINGLAEAASSAS